MRGVALLTDLDQPWVKYVIGPDGSPLNFGDLPSQGPRLLIRRKAIVVAAVRGGLLSFEEVCRRGVSRLWRRATRARQQASSSLMQR